MGTEMNIYDGMSITISQQEADVIAHSPLPILMKAFADYQSRALVIGRPIGHDLDKSSQVEELETEVSSRKGEKENLMSEVSNLRSQLSQALTDRKSWKNRCLETNEKGKKTFEEITASKRVVEELKITNAELDKELWELRESVIEEHELGFKKAL
ncbi:hypothetical protein DEO72_LG8g1534 [Vigna unguiculata]|uniref:Uncharacterized protein n=1 Tax=Vigna unguiculata TaxID=3917 RepID=A0A4D6MTT7_VIGUN|nr:hypothetical protein DEO72_LG8g1534 [Vigna unguiculata]